MSRCGVAIKLLLVLISFAAHAQPSRTFIVGTQNFDYFPHYNFNSQRDKGFAWAVLQAFAKEQGIRFEYMPLPTARLERELLKGTIDFAYPDNARWTRDEKDSHKKSYSTPVALSVAGTMVRKERQGRGMDAFKTLAYPKGFVPAKWLPVFEQNPIRVFKTTDAKTSLQAVIMGNADGADIEYHVSQHLLSVIGQPERLVLDPELPISFVDFKLSTRFHGDILSAFNAFMRGHQAEIERLRTHYGLSDSRDPFDYVEPDAQKTSLMTFRPLR